MLPVSVTRALGPIAAPVIDERLVALRADVEDVIDTAMKLRERVIAAMTALEGFDAPTDGGDIIAAPTAPLEAPVANTARPGPGPLPEGIMRGGQLRPAASPMPAGVGSWQKACAASCDIVQESARDYVKSNTRFYEAFGMTKDVWQSEGWHNDPDLWKWLAAKPPADIPDSWTTNYAFIRGVDRTSAIAFIQASYQD